MDDMAYYRNRETGLIQAHPVHGLGEAFNSDEVGEDAKPILPLGSDAATVGKATKLAKGTKTTDASGDGDSNQRGAE